MAPSAERYNLVSIILHWVMGLAFFAMLISGFVMTREDLLAPAQKFEMYQIHKSVGVLLLWAFVLRLIWRFIKKPPSMPGTFKPWEQRAAKAGHVALYLWMFALPLTGWVMVSASPYGLPTIIFNWFEWPHIPGIEPDEGLSELMSGVHEFFAFSFAALIALHIGATLKHMFIDKHNILRRMLPALVLVMIAFPVNAGEYQVIQDESEIRFAGAHAGEAFEGVFEEWSADIVFDPEDLSGSSIRAVIKTQSAKTGNAMYDGTLPHSGWFDIKNHPEAVFESTSISEAEQGGYIMTGDLTIRGITQSLEIPFALEQQDDGTTSAKADFTINRMDFGIGQEPDPNAEWVSEKITITLNILAQH